MAFYALKRQLPDGDIFQNIQDKHSRLTIKGWSFSFGVGCQTSPFTERTTVSNSTTSKYNFEKYGENVAWI
jgi:hypothetical protein